MTIVVFSDSHGSDFEMAEVIRRQKRHADCFLHLGDGAVTFLELCDELGVLGYAVKGNCDHFLKGRDIPTSRMLTFEGISLFLAHGDAYGVTVTGASIDHAKVVERKEKVVRTLVSGIGAKMKGAGVTVVPATAVITGKTAEGFTVKSGEETYTAKQLLICTGSSAAVPPIPGLKESVESGFAVTNREILDLKVAPKRIAVVGGGVIGLEMASYFNSIGSEVTVIEMMDKIAGPTDKEVSALLQKNYAKRGVKFLLGAKVTV